MATQLRACVVRCGASGFAVDYWGHAACIGASALLARPRARRLARLPDAIPQTWHPPPRTSPSGAYFLTHAHSDHLVGLSDSWDPRGRPIYCSAITRALLELRHPALLRRADVRVVALAPDAPAVIQLDAFGEETASRGAVRPPATSDLARATFPASRAAMCVAPSSTVTPLTPGTAPGRWRSYSRARGRIFHTGDSGREDCAAEAPPSGTTTTTPTTTTPSTTPATPATPSTRRGNPTPPRRRCPRASPARRSTSSSSTTRTRTRGTGSPLGGSPRHRSRPSCEPTTRSEAPTCRWASTRSGRNRCSRRSRARRGRPCESRRSARGRRGGARGRGGGAKPHRRRGGGAGGGGGGEGHGGRARRRLGRGTGNTPQPPAPPRERKRRPNASADSAKTRGG